MTADGTAQFQETGAVEMALIPTLVYRTRGHGCGQATTTAHRQTETDRQTDRQTDRKTDTQTDTDTDRQTDRQTWAGNNTV